MHANTVNMLPLNLICLFKDKIYFWQMKICDPISLPKVYCINCMYKISMFLGLFLQEEGWLFQSQKRWALRRLTGWWESWWRNVTYVGQHGNMPHWFRLNFCFLGAVVFQEFHSKAFLCLLSERVIVSCPTFWLVFDLTTETSTSFSLTLFKGSTRSPSFVSSKFREFPVVAVSTTQSHSSSWNSHEM